MGRPRVLSIGNTVLDVIGKTPDELPMFGELAAGRGPADVDVGGNGAIAAAAASVLGADSALASTIGDDEWGEWLRDRLEELGVDVSQLLVAEGHPTATTLSMVRTDGERALLTHNGASEEHDLGSVDLSPVGEGDWVLLSSLFLVQAYQGEPLRTLVEGVGARGAMLAMDMAWDCTGEWELEDLAFDGADVVTGNALEMKAIACTTDLDGAVERMLRKGAGTLVIKMGAEGARAVDKDGVDHVVPSPEVVPMNATGTGDVFNAALLVALARGSDLTEAVRFACAAGALRVSGGCHTFPATEEVEALLERGA